jgi:hypothetical protein
MAQDRVDKRWQEVGLETYATEAILGTLAHYGPAIDEAKFRALAKDQYPLEMAIAWQEAWKGTGQFTLFPTAAFPELWRRLEKDRLAPGELAGALIDTLVALDQRTRDTKEGEAFAKVEALKARIPREGEGAEERFTSEAFAHFSEDAWQAFDEMAQTLAKGGHREDARTFAELEAFLLPERQGISQALVDAAEGRREEAVAALGAIAQDAGAAPERRMSAVDALLHLDAKDETLTHGLLLLEDAEKREDFHLGLALADKLLELLRERRDPRADDVEARLEKLLEAHHRAHPHHH